MRRIFLILLFFPAAALWAEGPGTSSAVFLTVPADPAAAALGGIEAVSKPSSLSVLYNPATLSGVTTPAAAFSHSIWLGDTSYNALAAARPYRGGTAAIGLRYLRYGAIASLDNAGNEEGSYSPHEEALSAGWGTKTGHWSAGMALKYINSKISSSADALAIDAAIGYASGDLSAGLTAGNIGERLRFIKESYPLPTHFRLAGAYRTAPDLTILAEGAILNSGRGWVAAGAEYPFRINGVSLALRCGYSGRYVNTGGFNGLTAGFGLSITDFTFDYALTEAGELGNSHQFAASLRWGKDSEGNKERAAILMAIPGGRP